MDSQDPSRPPGDIQILTQDEEEEILKEDEVKQPKQGDDSLPNMLTSLNDNIAHMAKSFSTLSETLASFTAEKGRKRDSRQLPDPAAKRQKLSPCTSSQVSDSDEDIQELLTTDTNCDVNNGASRILRIQRLVKTNSLMNWLMSSTKMRKVLLPSQENSLISSTSDGRQNFPILSSVTEWKNTSGRRTATKFSCQGSTKKYGPGSPAKQSVMIYGLLLYKRYLLKLVPFWLNVLTNWWPLALNIQMAGKCLTRTWTAYWAHKLMLWPYWGMLIMTFRFVDAK